MSMYIPQEEVLAVPVPNASSGAGRMPSILDEPTEVPRGVMVNPPAPPAKRPPPVWFSYNAETDEVMLDGIKFTASFFRTFALAPRGTLMRLQERKDGVVEVRVYNRGQQVFA